LRRRVTINDDLDTATRLIINDDRPGRWSTVHVIEDVRAAMLQRGVAVPLHLGKSVIHGLRQNPINI
jgi:hypothetical protein